MAPLEAHQAAKSRSPRRRPKRLTVLRISPHLIEAARHFGVPLTRILEERGRVWIAREKRRRESGRPTGPTPVAAHCLRDRGAHGGRSRIASHAAPAGCVGAGREERGDSRRKPPERRWRSYGTDPCPCPLRPVEGASSRPVRRIVLRAS